MTKSTERTVGNAFFFGFLRLFLIHLLDGGFIKYTDIQELRVFFTAKDILENASMIRDLWVPQKLIHPFLYLFFGIGMMMVLIVQAAPFQTAHFLPCIFENRIHPVNDRIKVIFQFINAPVIPMASHVILNIPMAYPVQSPFQNGLPFGVSFDIGLPAIHIGIVGIGKLLSCQCDEGTVIGCIAKLLLYQGTPAILMVSNHASISEGSPSQT